MSLLMNALKKAETAKAAGEAAGEANTVQPAETSGTLRRDLTRELGLDPQPTGSQPWSGAEEKFGLNRKIQRPAGS